MRPSTSSLLRSLCRRHFGSTNNNLPSLANIIPSKHRSSAFRQAQEVLTDYFQNTSALPFTYAEKISKNSLHSLYQLISNLPSSSSDIRKSLQKFLRYNPINEFGFFFESIGIDFAEIGGFSKPNVLFFHDDYMVPDVACCLAGFGFPWDKLGKLYVEEVSIFRKRTDFLIGRLDELTSLGFGHQQIVGICLTFPGLLKEEEIGFGSDFKLLLDDLKRGFIDFDLGSSMMRNVDVWFEVCRKVKVFYDLGVAKGEVGKLIANSRSILTDYPEAVLVEKVEFFSRLGVDKSKAGVLILSNPEILSIKLNDRVISVSSILEHFGLCERDLLSVKENFEYVFGRNKMMNLPNILRAADLHNWFFHRMESGYHNLFASYDLCSPVDVEDENYIDKLERLKSKRTYSYAFRKMEFFHGIGFGENGFTAKLLFQVHGSPRDLQERFDFLLNEGIEYSKLCKLISRAPRLLNQEIDSLKKKLDYFEQEIGLPLDNLDPGYLLFNLEKRIKPRYKFHEWLIELGLCKKTYTLGSTIGVNNKRFLSRLSGIHPDAPRLWLEKYGKKTDQ